ncbi:MULTISPECIES: Cof-type HAD-IIB family hydrolase [Bacillaceae]|jgi:Cof subfamily protein (haloacid dehalogenase superfamily)|uniref:HAD family hydrolase n=2 Tax=Bacillus infantis TaxID=324767 RepID=U5LDE5_9BACI|nr:MULTISPECIES: Cof-type HAD-IIB family hydrolase [Bacillus]OXT18120.1 HAD family hydrolase [Bacillus sp. OG2]AGX04637.1 HAD family hydrolase [Bacillus infantis NRRL B-14911]EAR68294.1 hydrolase (HAD superfamily) protein [Bacillus sp. NRRL B-14911]MCK6205544.1 Cof-type HAD-IIB family hydrolase [Bacillus infantis]MCP1158725.1 Cof-type HAD-IIB family hydrolase [Bacillus infantis]
MSYKIIFFDVDGTITHHEDGSISDKMKETIFKLKEQGIKVAAATGRPLSLCREIEELGIDTFVTANGGYVKHRDQVIHKVTLDPQVIRDVAAFSLAENHGLSYFTEEFSTNGVQSEEILKTLKETLAFTDYPPFYENIHEQEVYLMCLYANEEMMEKYIRAFPDLSFQRWHPFIANVLQKEVSKSLAIMKVLEFFEIEPSEMVAFGDGNNDIDMLELAGLGIAMGNGTDELKAISDFVTRKSSEDGIGYALKKFGMLE